MRLIYLFLISILAFCAPILVCGQDKKLKSKHKVAVKSAICKLNEVSFPCPKSFKIILNGENTGLFLTQHLDKYDKYGLFVIALKDTFDEQTLVTETKEVLLKTLYPKESANYKWKEIDFISNGSLSKFEVGKSISLGFNENNLVIFAYRHISINNKHFLIGSVSNNEEKGEKAKEMFNDISGSSPSGCGEEIKIISSITGEKSNEKSSVCRVELQTAN